MYKSIYSFIMPLVLSVGLLLSACTVTEIRHSPVTSEQYMPIENQGQVSADTVNELASRYPAGFQEAGNVVIPPGQEKKVSVKPFSSSPAQKETARSATGIFAAALTRSNSFVLVERAQLDGIIDEFELNQSGLMDQNNAPDTGNMDTVDIIITGDILQMSDGFRLQARAVDMNSGRVLLTEQIDNMPTVTARMTESLAMRLISGLQEIVYPR